MNIERYNRHIILPEIGIDGQRALNDAKVLVVGAGGLGSPVLLYLAAAGIGTIGIVDNDVVSLNNLQRQVLYSVSDIGELKANKAKERILANNPDVVVNTYVGRFSDENGKKIASEYDIIVDCTDNYESRYVIDNVCFDLGIPMVYGSISKFNGQVSVFNYKGGKRYCNLFAEKPVIDMNESGRLGVLGVLPGIIGCIQVNETIKVILKMDGVLRNKLLLLNTKNMETQIVGF